MEKQLGRPEFRFFSLSVRKIREKTLCFAKIKTLSQSPRNLGSKVAMNPNDFQNTLRAAQRGAGDELFHYLEGFRQYLSLLAGDLIEPELHAKVGASDLVQDTLLTATREIKHFRGACVQELLAWLVEILTNHHKMVRRRYLGTQKRNARKEVSLASRTNKNGSRAIAGNDPSPSSHAAKNEQMLRLNSALGRISPRHRQIIEMRQLGQLPYGQIAQVMQISEVAARQLWVRAIDCLKRELA